MGRKIRQILPAFLITVVLSALTMLAFRYNFFEGVERKLFDYRLMVRGQVPQSDKVVVAVISNESVKDYELGRWPWPRIYQAFLVDNLNAYGAKVIGYDVFFPEGDESVPFSGLRSYLRTNFEDLGLANPDLSKEGEGKFLKSLETFYQKSLGAAFLNSNPDEQLVDEVKENLNPDNAFATSLANHDNVILGYYFNTGKTPEKHIRELQPVYKSLSRTYKEAGLDVPAQVKQDYNNTIDFLRDMQMDLDEQVSYSAQLQKAVDFSRRFDIARKDMLEGKVQPDGTVQLALEDFYNQIKQISDDLRVDLTQEQENPDEQITESIKENVAGMEASSIPYKSPPGSIEGFVRAPNLTPNFNLFTKNTKNFGHVSVEPDPDGVIRYNMVAISLGKFLFPSLSIKAASMYLGQELSAVMQPRGVPPIFKIGDRVVPLNRYGQLLINYHGSKRYPEYDIFDIIRSMVVQAPYEDSIPAYFKDVLNTTPEDYFKKLYKRKSREGDVIDMLYNATLPDDDTPIWFRIIDWESEKLFEKKYGMTPQEAFKDKVVLVGATATGIYDLRVTPFSENYPGVMIHAQVIDSILSGRFLSRPMWGKIYGLALIIGLAVVLGIIIPLISAVRGAVIIVGLAIALVCVDYFYFFRLHGWWMPLIYPAMQMGVVFFAVTIYRYATEEKEKRWIKDTFGRYLAPSVVEQLTKNPELVKLGGQSLEMTAFFSDIRGFSTISEKLGNPQLLVELLNDYLSAMAHVIESYEGTIDKYEGDAIIAFWGAPVHFPDHAVKACFACLDQQIMLAELREKWSRGDKWPQIVHDARVRMGLNTGAMVVGNMGSAGRMNYTIMGDAVNLASRLEGANKPYGTYIMISEFTYQAAKDYIEVRELDSLRVVGKTEPVRVYELLSRKGELTPQKQRVIEIYNEGLAAYKKQDWDAGIARFGEALQIDPEDGPSKTYLARCEEFKLEPPGADWDGVYTLESK